MTLGLGASACWAVANRYVQISARNDGELPSLWWSQLLGTLLYVPLWWADGAPFGAVPLGVLGMTAAASMLAYFAMSRAYRLGPLTVMVPIVATWSVITALIGVIFLGERPGPLQVFGALLAVGGGVANGALREEGVAATWSAPKLHAIGWAVAASLGFGVLMVGVSRLTDTLGAAGVMPAVWLTQWAFFAPLWRGRALMWRWPKGPGAIAAMGALEALGFLCAAIGSRVAPLAIVGPASSLSSVMTVVAVRIWTGEPLSMARWTCVIVASVGVVLLGT